MVVDRIQIPLKLPMGLEPISLRLTKAALYQLSYGSALKYLLFHRRPPCTDVLINHPRPPQGPYPVTGRAHHLAFGDLGQDGLAAALSDPEISEIGHFMRAGQMIKFHDQRVPVSAAIRTGLVLRRRD